MAGRGATTFKKRQKEQARNEKRQDKLARRLNKKADEEPNAAEAPETEVLIAQDGSVIIVAKDGTVLDTRPPTPEEIAGLRSNFDEV
jgi:hypothetical protein